MPHLVANAILIPEMDCLLKEGREILFTPSGNSMRPFIEGGKDTVLLKKKDDVKVGDMCLAWVSRPHQEQQSYVLHRVIRIEGERVVLMGDGNLQGEEYCTSKDIIGTVVRITTPWGTNKPVTKGRLWKLLLPQRWFWLKVYRHTILKCY